MAAVAFSILALVFGQQKVILHQLSPEVLFLGRYPVWSVRYGDGAGNTVEENSSVFSLIRMR